MSDIDELFSRLKTSHRRDSPDASLWENKLSNQQLPVSTPRQIMPRGATEQSMSNNLLTLLNIRPETHRSASNTADVSKPVVNANVPRAASASFARDDETEPPANTQRFLLDLLTKPKTAADKTDSIAGSIKGASQSAAPQSPAGSASTPSVPLSSALLQSVPALPTTTTSAEHTSTAETKLSDLPQAMTIATPTQAKAPSIASSAPRTPDISNITTFDKLAQSFSANKKFNYVNPFDQLHASSPLKTPQDKASVGQEKATVAQRLESTHQEIVKDIDRVLEQAIKAQDAAENANEHRKTNTAAESDYTTVPETTPESKDWSTAEDEAAEEDVIVYSFPMRPFVTIELKGRPRSFRKSTWASTTPVARLKKEFSHDDRVLAAASQSHIIYAVSSEKKPAGLKVIQQDDGKNKQIWSGSERICSVQISGDQVLATGVEGTIFYTELTDLDGDIEGFHMSPPPNSDEPNAGGFATSSAIRTRAKLGPQIAVARGRRIHLFEPKEYMSRGRGRVEPTFKNSSINTGKAGKDFCFSEDGTVLASLDKLGKIKFWQLPVQGELTEPLHAIETLQDRPTSIMFIDKDRAHSKKTALRYVLVGFQQNHVLQLWDLGLGKCVQELRLPMSEMLCSVSYHPKTGMVFVGHPGRNSIYVLHLSCPKYNIPTSTTQSEYIRSLPGARPESTAIMSGVREFAFTPGILRSIDVLKSDSIELYIMHSKGVIAVPLEKEDLGLDAKGKAQKSADAVAAGVAIIHDYEPPMSARKMEKLPAREEQKVDAPPAYTPPAQPIAVEEKTMPPAYSPPNQDAAVQEKKQPLPPVYAQSSSQDALPDAGSAAAPALAAVPEKTTTAPTDTRAVSSGEAPKSKTSSLESEKAPSPAPAKIRGNLPITPPVLTAESYKMTDPPHTQTPSEVSDHAVADHFADLYTKLENDRRVAEAAATARQDAMLRLVSTTLTDNVEQSLHKIVSNSITQQVLPALSTQLITNVDRALKTLPATVQQQVQSTLPEAVRGAVDAIVPKIATEVSKGLEMKIKQAVASETERMTTMLSSKIEQHLSQKDQQVLTALQASEQRVMQLLSSMQAHQVQFAERLDALRSAEPGHTKETEEEVSQEKDEVQHLTALLNNGEYEQATIEWLQSSNQALFDDLFVRINPAYLQRVSPLVALSVSVAVTSSFDHNVEKRLEWLSSVLEMDLKDPEIRDVVPKIMDILVQRLQGAYMQIAEAEGSAEVLKKVVQLNRLIGEVRKTLH